MKPPPRRMFFLWQIKKFFDRVQIYPFGRVHLYPRVQMYPFGTGTFIPDRKNLNLSLLKEIYKRILAHRPLWTIPASFRQIGRQQRRQAAGTFIPAGTNVPVRSGTFVPGITKIQCLMSYCLFSQSKYSCVILVSCSMKVKLWYTA